MKKRLLPVVLLALSVLSPSSPGFAETGEREENFFQANQAYREGRYAEAAEGYRALLAGEGMKGHLYYNLGNTLFRMGDSGRAILNYERARTLLPRDADLRFNLVYAREGLLDAVPEDEELLGAVFFWLDSVTLAEIFWLFALFNLLFWAAAAGRLFSRADGLYYGFIFLLLLWLSGGVSFGMKWYQSRNDARAVVLPAEVRVLAGPSEGDTVLFKLHAGTTVDRERTEGDWALIRLAGGKRGWVPAADVEGVRREPGY